MVELKIFNRWSTEGITVDDMGLKDYVCMTPKVVPRTGARYAKFRFHKSQANMVERFINKLMIPGHRSKKHYISSGKNTGKGIRAYALAEKTFLLIEGRTKENPIKVFVKAVENAAPREEVTAIEYGGARYAKALEMAPQRRIDFVMRLMIQGAYQKSFGKKIKAEEALADEIINAYKLSNMSVAIAKKLEMERQADSSR